MFVKSRLAMGFESTTQAKYNHKLYSLFHGPEKQVGSLQPKSQLHSKVESSETRCRCRSYCNDPVID